MCVNNYILIGLGLLLLMLFFNQNKIKGVKDKDIKDKEDSCNCAA